MTDNARIAKAHCAIYVAKRDGVSDWCLWGQKCRIFERQACDYFDKAVLPGVRE